MPYRPMYVLAGNGVSDASPDMLTRCNEARWPPSPEATTMGDACLGSALEKRRRCCGRKPLLPIRGANRMPLDIFAKKAGHIRRVVFLGCESSGTTGVWKDVGLLQSMRYLGMALTKVSLPHSVTSRKISCFYRDARIAHALGARTRRTRLLEPRPLATFGE